MRSCVCCSNADFLSVDHGLFWRLAVLVPAIRSLPHFHQHHLRGTLPKEYSEWHPGSNVLADLFEEAEGKGYAGQIENNKHNFVVHEMFEHLVQYLFFDLFVYPRAKLKNDYKVNGHNSFQLKNWCCFCGLASWLDQAECFGNELGEKAADLSRPQHIRCHFPVR